MGRIEELIPGQDGLIRGVKLKVMSKTGISATCRKLSLSRYLTIQIVTKP